MGIVIERISLSFGHEVDRTQTALLHRLSIKKRQRKKSRSWKTIQPGCKNRFLKLIVYYRLYITYTLAGFLFDLDQSNICRDIQKIEGLVRECIPIPQNVHSITKRLKNFPRK